MPALLACVPKAVSAWSWIHLRTASSDGIAPDPDRESGDGEISWQEGPHRCLDGRVDRADPAHRPVAAQRQVVPGVLFGRPAAVPSGGVQAWGGGAEAWQADSDDAPRPLRQTGVGHAPASRATPSSRTQARTGTGTDRAPVSRPGAVCAEEPARRRATGKGMESQQLRRPSTSYEALTKPVLRHNGCRST